MRLPVMAAAIVLLVTSSAMGKQLKPETVAAFDTYVNLTEQRMTKELNSGNFLWVDAILPQERDADYARLRKGEAVIQQLATLQDGHALTVPDGLIHHWIGIIFIPNISLTKTVDLLQDYDDQYRFFAPEVERSRLLSRQGDEFHVSLRLRRKKVIMVVLNTEYDVLYSRLAGNRVIVNSYSTRITEVEHAGEVGESEKPPGRDDGFLWRLNSYWRLWERDGGTYVQLEAISLTRNIPAGLGWLVRPLVTSIPRESLEFTLNRTRSALGGAR